MGIEDEMKRLTKKEQRKLCRTCGEVLLAWGYKAFQRCMHSTRAHRTWMTERLQRVNQKHLQRLG
jgi:hypothetical protein